MQPAPPPRPCPASTSAPAQLWIDYGKGADGRQIASDLRFMIEKALAEAGIAVPYPQRDVHLDAGGPLKVEVVSRAEPQALRRDARG